jgi:hypothetical protein
MRNCTRGQSVSSSEPSCSSNWQTSNNPTFLLTRWCPRRHPPRPQPNQRPRPRTSTTLSHIRSTRSTMKNTDSRAPPRVLLLLPEEGNRERPQPRKDYTHPTNMQQQRHQAHLLPTRNIDLHHISSINNMTVFKKRRKGLLSHVTK